MNFLRREQKFMALASRKSSRRRKIALRRVKTWFFIPSSGYRSWRRASENLIRRLLRRHQLTLRELVKGLRRRHQARLNIQVNHHTFDPFLVRQRYASTRIEYQELLPIIFLDSSLISHQSFSTKSVLNQRLYRSMLGGTYCLIALSKNKPRKLRYLLGNPQKTSGTSEIWLNWKAKEEALRITVSFCATACAHLLLEDNKRERVIWNAPYSLVEVHSFVCQFSEFSERKSPGDRKNKTPIQIFRPGALF